MKGFQRLIPLMRLPARGRPADRGHRPVRGRRSGPWPRDLPNVRFEGLLGGPALARLFHGARAVVVPSLFPETFGYVVLEAFAVRTPVVVHLEGGALAETGVQSGGGLATGPMPSCCWPCAGSSTTTTSATSWPHRGYAMRTGEWSEAAHLDRYFGLIQSIRAAKAPPSPHRPAASDAPHEHDRHAQARTEPPMRPRTGDLLACLVLVDADPRLLRAPGRPAARLDRRRRAAQHRLRPARRSPAGGQRPDVHLPAPLSSVSETMARDRTAAALGRGGVRRAAAGRQPAGRPVLPAGLAGLVRALARGARLADRRAPALGRARRLRSDARTGARPLAGDRGGRLLRGVALPAGPDLRGALSPRLGGELVSLGILGLRPASPRPSLGNPGAAADPRTRLPDRPSPGVVLPGPGAEPLGTLRRLSPGQDGLLARGRAGTAALGELAGPDDRPGGGGADPRPGRAGLDLEGGPDDAPAGEQVSPPRDQPVATARSRCAGRARPRSSATATTGRRSSRSASFPWSWPRSRWRVIPTGPWCAAGRRSRCCRCCSRRGTGSACFPCCSRWSPVWSGSAFPPGRSSWPTSARRCCAASESRRS